MRIVSVWLPRWPILRFLATQMRDPSGEPVDPARPFVLSADASGGPRIAALNVLAEKCGLAIGDPLADARAKAEGLQTAVHNPAADDTALRRLTLWATRYTPSVSPFGDDNGADGFFLDITGAAHLFGGEEKLLADLSHRLSCFGLQARLAIADTPGAAWALSRYHPLHAVVMPSGQEAEAIASLPIEALRLSPDTRTTLRRLGFKRVGALIDKPRAPFAARFETELLTRLDQALGHATEPLRLIVPPPVYHSTRYLLEPIWTQDAVMAVATRLMKDLVHPLVRDGVGARALRLSLYRVDGNVSIVDIGLTMPTRDSSHVARLIDLKLERFTEDIDAGFGFETLGLAVTIAEPMNEQQTQFTSVLHGTHEAERCAKLIDHLQQRLGPDSVQQIASVESHCPEKAEAFYPATEQPADWPTPDESRLRPLLLLPHAEPALNVTAVVPDGPPQRFRWRGAMHDVLYSQGPERIASEWWRSNESQPTRDYYVVEDKAGHRFWLYREGLYGRETNAARWFVHGLFA
jgi:protein ImuB